MKLGKEVGLGPGHTVLDGDPAPLPKGHPCPALPTFERGTTAPNSRPMSVGQTAGLIKIPVGTPRPIGDIVLDRDAAPPNGGAAQVGIPTFRPMSIVTKRLNGSICHLVRR